MIRIVPASALALLLALAPAAWAQEAAVTKRATELRETPADSGRSLAPLPAQSAVTRTGERRGPWVQVRTAAGATGWVHLFDVGPAGGSASTEAPSGGSSNFLRGVGNLFTRSSPTQTGTTAGIRGLGAEDLAQAQPNPAAVTDMEKYRQNEADARSFGRRAPWQTVAVEPLPAPARAATGGRSNDPSNPESP